MPIDRELLGEVLSQLELHELELLSWGAVDAVMTEEELDSLIQDALPESNEHLIVRQMLLDQMLVVRVPTGGYRTRMAETVRLLSRLRQTFPNQQWRDGKPLVLDYRLVHRPRRRPRLEVPGPTVVDKMRDFLGTAGADAAATTVPEMLRAFQGRAAMSVLDALSAPHDRGTIITTGTGSGKTLAFYLPALSWLVDRVGEGHNGVRLLAVYPRGELLKDQLRAVLQWTRKIGPAGGRPLRLATWFGLTPRAGHWLKQGWMDSWTEQRSQGNTAGWICPFLVCPDCDGSLVWRIADVNAKRERLYCTECGGLVDETEITLTRERAQSSPADIMFTTTESLNRQLAAPDQHRAFGLHPDGLRMVLLDEVHTYEGSSGAQNALLMRRLRRAVRGPIAWGGLSATLENAEDFFSEFVGVFGDRVTGVGADLHELEESGGEYLLALRHDPGSLTGPLSTTIQAAMALTRSLDAPGSPYEPAPDSDGLFGRKTFVFTDKLDVTNRLYWDLLDAEGWWQQGRPKNRRILTLAHLRAEEQARRDPPVREDANERDQPGQWWWLAEQLGRDLDGDEQLVVGRTSSQDAGVDSSADVIVATATLEVGYDDDDVGAVLQHKAPHDAARFLQRKGRAGRVPAMRPWTVVVLSDWGRDRISWQLYDQLFDPILDPQHLPLRNRYVLRMQAVYGMLDWLGGRLASVGTDRSAWADMSAPATTLETSPARVEARTTRQARAADLLREVLTGGPASDHLRTFLRRSLGLEESDRGWAELDALLWGPPRPLMTAVIPTALRRLETSWSGETPQADEFAVRTRTPLREFIAGNLFEDLLLPEVEIAVPTGREIGEYRPQLLPAIRTIRELMPGNVTRHFGISTFSRRHWVEIPLPTQGHATTDIVETYGAVLVGTARAVLDGREFDLYRPMSSTVAVPPENLRDATAVSPNWDLELEALGTGAPIEIASDRWSQHFSRITVHSHANGDGVRVRRFATSASGSVFIGGEPEPVVIDFEAPGSGTRPVALGIEFEADAMRMEFRAAAPTVPPSPRERTDRLRELLERDEQMPQGLNWFQRSALASAAVVVAANRGHLFASSVATMSDDDLSAEMIDALALMGSLSARDPHALEAGDDDDPQGANRQPPMERWCRDSVVLERLRHALTVVAASERDSAWTRWFSHRMAATAAMTVLEASCLLSADLDVDELAIDVVAGPTPMEWTIWISETSPGGNGQVEQLHRLMAHEPKRFLRLLDRALERTDLEMLHDEVTAFLQTASSIPDVRSAAADVQAAWPRGHQAVAEALEHLRRVTAAGGVSPSRTAWTTITNRILGPGASDGLIDLLMSLIERWDQLESESGLSVGSREFGALQREAVEVDAALRLPPAVTPVLRSRAIANAFWPRDGGSALGGMADPFNHLPLVDREALRLLLPPAPSPIDILEWNDSVRVAVHAALVSTGTVDLAFSLGAGRLMRTAILDLQHHPVEAAALLVHPSVIGVQDTGGRRVVSLTLPEVA